jgi:hypothetical protein
MHILKMEADTWRQVASKELAGKVSTVAFSPNGQWLLAISDESLRLFSVPSWKEALSQLDPQGSVDGISFSPDGKWIALKSSSGRHGSVTTIRVFELATRRAAGWFTDPASSNVPRSQITSGGDQKLVGNSASWPTIRLGGQAAKSSDGRWITDPWRDPWKGLTLTDAQLQRPAVIVQHDGKVTDAAFSPNGRWLATASEDRSVCMWPLWAEDLLPLARLRLQRNLTYDEWWQAFENGPYSKTCPDLPIDPKFVEAGQKLAEKGDVKGATAIFRRAMELQPDLKLDPKAEAQRLAEAAKRANAAKTTEQERP